MRSTAPLSAPPALPTTRALVIGLGGGLAMAQSHLPLGIWLGGPLGAGALALIAIRSSSTRIAARAGFAFGLAAYLPALGWLYIGVRADDAPVLAYAAPSLLIASFALLPAIAAAIVRHCHRSIGLAALCALPALWCIGEWLRQFGEFRFPWTQLAYGQLDGPMAYFLPLVGVPGVGLLVISLGVLLSFPWLASARRTQAVGLGAASILLLLGMALRGVVWTQASGEPVSVALLQGNFPLNEKFDTDKAIEALQVYATFASRSQAQVSIVPETALPMADTELPAGYLQTLTDTARQQQRDLLLSFFRPTTPRTGQGKADSKHGHHNSARVLGVSGTLNYDKRILLPFGEYVPAARWLTPLYRRIATVPMIHTIAGEDAQAPLILGGRRVALRLCFEDLFGNFQRAEVAAANYLVVLANDSWDGSDLPTHQHLRVAQARAREAAKPVVRVANTGWSGVIGHDGTLGAQLPLHARAVLETTVQGRSGITPYVRHGDSLPLGLALLLLGITAVHGRTRVVVLRTRSMPT